MYYINRTVGNMETPIVVEENVDDNEIEQNDTLETNSEVSLDQSPAPSTPSTTACASNPKWYIKT